MSDESRPSVNALSYCFFVFAIAVGYVASVGPVAYAFERLGLSPHSRLTSVLQGLYWPLEIVMSESDAFRDFLRWYVRQFAP